MLLLTKFLDMRVTVIKELGSGSFGHVLLAQHNEVTAVDVIQEKVDKLNRWISPIQDIEIEHSFVAIS